MDGKCLKLTLTFYCCTSHCQSHALPCDITAFYIHSRETLPACRMSDMQECKSFWVQLLFSASYLHLCVCVCVIADARCGPNCHLFNPRANMEFKETLSVENCSVLLLALMYRVHSTLCAAADA